MAKKAKSQLQPNDVLTIMLEKFTKTFDDIVDSKNGVQTAQIIEHLNGITASIAAFTIETIKFNKKDAEDAIVDYYAFRDATLDEIEISHNALPQTAKTTANYGRIKLEFKNADKAVALAEKFVEGKMKITFNDPETKEQIKASLDDLVKAYKKKKKGDVTKDVMAGTLSALLGTSLPLAIRPGIAKIKEEWKKYNENSGWGKAKTAGSLLAGGLGVLTGSAAFTTLASWGKEHSNKDLQIQQNSKKLRDSIQERITKSKKNQGKIDLVGSGGIITSRGRRSRGGGSDSSMSDMLDELFNVGGISITQRDTMRAKGYAKGGIVDIKGRANSMLGGARVNEEGAEQAIILPARKSPLDILIQKVTETNDILYEQLDEQQDQARLAALAHKESKKETSPSLLKPITTPTATTEKSGGILTDLMMMKALESLAKPTMLSAITAIAIPVLGALAVGGAVIGLSMLAKNLWDNSEMGKEHAKKQEGERKKADTRIAAERAANPNRESDMLADAYANENSVTDFYGTPKMAKGGNVIVGEAGAESLRVTPKDNKDFPSGSSRNPFYIVQDDRKRKRNPDDIKLAALQTKAFSAMQVNNSAQGDESFASKISSIWSGNEGIGDKLAQTGQQAWTSAKGAASGAVKALGKGFGFVKDSIFGASKATGVDAGTMTKFAQVESGFNAGAKAGTSSATGLYQFTKGTWDGMIAKYGKKHGLDASASPTDPNANALMAGEYINENKKALQAAGIPATDGALYLTHFLGGAGGVKMLKANANSSAAQLFPDAARANRSVFYDGQREKTVGEIIGWADKKMNIDVSKIYASANIKQPAMAPIDSSVPVGQRNMREGSVKNIKFNARGAGEGSRLKAMEVGVDAQMQASHAQGTQQAINNISVGGGNSTPIPPANITTGDNMSFATRLAKSY